MAANIYNKNNNCFWCIKYYFEWHYINQNIKKKKT